MRKFIKNNKDVLIVIALMFIWRVGFLIVQMNRYKVKMREGYLGFLRIANFDGNYYLTIATSGYHGLDQAFFPLFPLAINVFIRLGFDPISAAIIVVTGSFFGFLYSLLKLIKIDYKDTSYVWVLLFYLSFPTSFFLTSIYTESFFLFLTISSFYFARKGKMLLAGLFGMFASATRVIGIFLLPSLVYEVYTQQKKNKKRSIVQYAPLLLIPLGLFSYMAYLWYKYNDPILFVHQQPLFGAGRSGGGIVLLPQVIYRYIKIFLSISPSDLVFLVSALEITTLCVTLLLLFLAYKKGVRKSYIMFSLLSLLFPTMSGTLSSFPRYALASFAVFIYLGLLKSRLAKIILIILGIILQGVLALLFLQGYFVA